MGHRFVDSVSPTETLISHFAADGRVMFRFFIFANISCKPISPSSFVVVYPFPIPARASVSAVIQFSGRDFPVGIGLNQLWPRRQNILIASLLQQFVVEVNDY